MSKLWVTGYRSYELGIFKEDDEKVEVIKSVLKESLIQKIETGVDWIITGIQFGVEQWTIEIANDLKKKYPNDFKIAVFIPFLEFNKNWNEENRTKVKKIISYADFSTEVSKKIYNSPVQLKNYQKFMIEHSDEALLLYDPEFEGKTNYDLKKIKKYEETNVYSYELIDMDILQEAANQIQEQKRINKEDE
ncbi:DUF1273 family protein [Lactobacillus sp. S2-2]|uniref:DUF1273 domain-containing protein n=1 Tax=Lactobacillus sp. S2-2 TaxID=2692917 RepID=UPI001F2D9764|nr:DUF1273 domain-containing protein [Lactobacillus sp. S2-2]MCF6515067.1 DUF1273 family protein [Lactobacillus sp. S2-2]